MNRRIRVAAVVLQRADGAVLTVRKRGTHVFMNPGGKPEAGEAPADCAVREVAEELGLHVDPADLEYLGDFEAPAANEPDHLVEAWVFRHPAPVPDHVAPAAEIDAVAWVHPGLPASIPLAPLFVTQILPALRAAGLVAG